MKPIHQTQFAASIDDPKTTGNCWPAAIASVLELELAAVPFFTLDDDWWSATNRWLGERHGFELVSFVWGTGDAAWTPSGYHLMSGKSPRGDFSHVVVGHAGEMVHDPHPSGDGLEKLETVELFVAIDPARSW